MTRTDGTETGGAPAPLMSELASESSTLRFAKRRPSTSEGVR